jgi:hypothetical protein
MQRGEWRRGAARGDRPPARIDPAGVGRSRQKSRLFGDERLE